MTTTPFAAPATTRVPYVAFLMLGGVIAAAQIGKAVVALPIIRTELHLSLATASLLLSLFAALAAGFGFAIGIIAKEIGARRVVVGCMLCIATGSLIGGLAASGTVLIATRVIEGIGFLGTVMAVPDLLNRAVALRHRDVAFGLWSSYMPVGQLAMMLVGPALPFIGWRALWLGDSGIALLYAAFAFFLVPPDPPRSGPRRSIVAEGRAAIANRSSLLLALAFGTYTFLYFGISGFLPVLLVSRLGLPIATASLFTAAAIAANAVGNASAGLLPRLGAPIWFAPAICFTGYGVASIAVFLPGMPAWAVAVVASTALGFGGLAPGTVMVAIPRLAPRPDLVTPIVGLVQQASNFGQFAGPLCAGLVVQHFGWSAAPFGLFPAALLGLATTYAIAKRVK